MSGFEREIGDFSKHANMALINAKENLIWMIGSSDFSGSENVL
jgi:hypothetical protein